MKNNDFHLQESQLATKQSSLAKKPRKSSLKRSSAQEKVYSTSKLKREIQFCSKNTIRITMSFCHKARVDFAYLTSKRSSGMIRLSKTSKTMNWRSLAPFTYLHQRIREKNTKSSKDITQRSTLNGLLCSGWRPFPSTLHTTLQAIKRRESVNSLCRCPQASRM